MERLNSLPPLGHCTLAGLRGHRSMPGGRPAILGMVR
jgi:hypothetical protein